VPSFQNPSGQCIGHTRRQALARALQGSGSLLVEDDPYGELWYDAPPPPPIAAQAPLQTVYLGSFSKVLAPGLRVGFLVAPSGTAPETTALRAKLLQAKQACDLHTPSLNQRIVMQLFDDGFDFDRHLDEVRVRYRAQRDAMDDALHRHLPAGFAWLRPPGGMFFWLHGPEGFDAQAHLMTAVEHGAAYVPGSAFHAPDHIGRGDGGAPGNSLRLSFVTLSPSQIDQAVAKLARSLALVGKPQVEPRAQASAA
jgi:2-aminoadipate transaminase